MPRWNNNPVDVTLGIKIYDAGGYRLKVESAKPFANTLKQGQTEQVGGVRVHCKIIAAPDQKDVGQAFMVNCYEHNEAGRSFSKQFIVPCYGLPATKEGEEKFNESMKDVAEDFWHVDVENNSVGQGWLNMVGKEVNADLNTKIDNTGNKQQTAKYMPI